MNKKTLKIIVCLIIFCSQSVFTYAYDNINTHPELSEKVVIETKIFQQYLIDYLGLPQGIESKLIDNTTIIGWIQVGSTNEDEPNCQASNHFHNPLLPWDESFMSDDTSFIGQRIRNYCSDYGWPFSNRKSLITWATGYLEPSPDGLKESEWGTNEPFNWDFAKRYYYTHLTGKDYDGNVIAESDLARKLSLVWSFEALGHVLHLIQDVSVPAHVRNDFTSHLMLQNIGFSKPKSWFIQPFEYYIQTHGNNIIKSAPIHLPAFENPSLTDFWDTDQFKGGNSSVGLNQGLAEFTNANYLSEYTIPNNSPTAEHQFAYPQINSQDYQLVKEDWHTEKRRYIARKNPVIPPPDGKNDTFAAVSVMNKIDEITDANISNIRLFLYDDNVNETYANELTPMAIGYSAALLDYFFRGSIELSIPDDGFYALTDDTSDPSNKGFKLIKLKARNITPNNEEMPDGTIELVVKYRLSETDPFTNNNSAQPTETPPEFHYIVVPAQPLQNENIKAIPRNSTVELSFDLTDNEIPLWATDVYLQVVYRGKLGNETDGIAVGFKDISEPSPIDLFNNMDKICFNGIWENAGDPALIAYVDNPANGGNENGTADEHDVYSHDLTNIYYRYFPVDSPILIPSSADGEHHYEIPAPEFINAGEFIRSHYILADYGEYNYTMRTSYIKQSNDPWDHYDTASYVSYDAVKNQLEWNGIDKYEPIKTPYYYPFRGVEIMGGIITVNYPYPDPNDLYACPLSAAE